jgi:tRNA 2-thiocytidine biosynthesis protein TtcA
MLDQWERDAPGRIDQIARPLGDVRASQLADPKLFDFLSLGRTGDSALPGAPPSKPSTCTCRTRC